MTRVALALVSMMAAMVTVVLVGAQSVAAGDQETVNEGAELKRVLSRVLAPPNILAEKGFAARLLIAPGASKLYDPLFMHDHSGSVWINDDGGQEGDRQGQILAIDRKGKISDVVALGRILPAIGFDIAPASFKPYGGNLFTVSQVEVGRAGADKGHVVQRIDPTTHQEAETFCTLPPAGGADGKGLPSWGMEGRFGPDGTPFAGKFFAVTATNSTVYQVTPDGRCTPFVSFDPEKWGGGKAFGLAFSPDGQYMLVSMLEGGMIVRVHADGTVENQPLVHVNGKKVSLWGMEYAPAGFGDYGGQLFVTALDGGKRKMTVYLDQTEPADGEIYRVTPEGEAKRVASGFRFPVGVHFVGNRLWISDPNADFTGGRELPDGFIVEITPAP